MHSWVLPWFVLPWFWSRTGLPRYRENHLCLFKAARRAARAAATARTPPLPLPLPLRRRQRRAASATS
jgi:hypothetical protein